MEERFSDFKELHNIWERILFFHLLVATDIFLIISFFFSMFVITVIVVVALFVLVSLFQLNFNNIRKNAEKQLQLQLWKQLHKNVAFSEIITPSLLFNIKFVDVFRCSRKKHSSYCYLFGCFYILIIYIYQNHLV